MRNSFFTFGLTTLALFFATNSSLTAQQSTSSRARNGWKLIWADEFSKDEINTKKWHVFEGADPQNSDLWYSAREKNVRVKDGVLVLEAHHEEDLKGKEGSAKLTSGRIQTASKDGALASFKYGRIEARIRFSTISGTLGRFTTVGTDFYEKSWPKCGEINVVEYLPRSPSQIWNTLRYEDKKGQQAKADNKGFNPFKKNMSRRKKFKTYVLEWNETELVFFCNNRVTHSVSLKDTVKLKLNPYKKSHFLLLAQSIGAWGGEYKVSDLPSKMEVDWVRVYRETADAKSWRQERNKNIVNRQKWRAPREKHIKDQETEIDL